MLPYSEDLRIRAIKAYEEGMSIPNVCQIFNISARTFYNWRKIYKDTGDVKPKQNSHPGHSCKVTDLEEFKAFAEENAHLTAKEMAQKRGNITSKTILKYLYRIGWTIKKRPMATKNAMKVNESNTWPG